MLRVTRAFSWSVSRAATTARACTLVKARHGCADDASPTNPSISSWRGSIACLDEAARHDRFQLEVEPRGVVIFWGHQGTYLTCCSMRATFCCRGARLGARSRRVFDDASLPAHWRDLERRVSNRKLRNLGDGPVGRGRPSKTEADYWLEAGLYDAPGAPRSTPTAASPASGRSLRARPPPRATSSDF